MNYRAIAVCALLSLGVAACDPFEEGNGGDPTIIGAQITGFDVDAFDNADFAGAYPATVAQPGATAGSWAINVPADGADRAVVQLFFNKLLNGATVQQTTTLCTPANDWVQVTPSTGCPWYSCYQPSSPTVQQGATILLFQACGPVTADDGPYDVAEPLPAGTFRITNAPDTVKDGGGRPVTIDVTITTPGVAPAT